MRENVKPKAVFLTDIIAPYRIAMFNAIARDPAYDFSVLFFAETMKQRSWDVDKQKIAFNYRVVPGFAVPVPRSFPLMINWGIAQCLNAVNPDVVICGGYNHPSYLLAMRYAKKKGKRLILWSESHARSVRVKSAPAMAYRRRVISRADAYLVAGERAADFLRQLGSGGKPIYIAGDVVENSVFEKPAAKMPHLPEHSILYAGRLLESKGVGTLLEAYKTLPEDSRRGLVLVGDGKDEAKFRRFVEQEKIPRVYFEGFKQQEELARYYASAEFLVMPSFRDEWGLVINEAMASGLPVIASEAAGAVPELVHPHGNGFSFTAGDGETLANLMRQLLENEPMRREMGQVSRRIIERFTPASCAAVFKQAILETAAGGDPGKTRREYAVV